MKCREARIELALLVGNDLEDPATRETLRRHVSTCPNCRTHYRQLKQAVSVLEQSDKEATYETRDSLWPALSQRLSQRREQPLPNRRTWWPLATFLAACLLVVFLIQPPFQSHPEDQLIDRSLLPSMTPGPVRDHAPPAPAIAPNSHNLNPHDPEVPATFEK